MADDFDGDLEGDWYDEPFDPEEVDWEELGLDEDDMPEGWEEWTWVDFTIWADEYIVDDASYEEAGYSANAG